MFRNVVHVSNFVPQTEEILEDYEQKSRTSTGAIVSTFMKRSPNEMEYPKESEFTLEAQLASGIPMQEINLGVMAPTEGESAEFAEYLSKQVEEIDNSKNE